MSQKAEAHPKSHTCSLINQQKQSDYSIDEMSAQMINVSLCANPCVSVPLIKYSRICLNISLCISGCVMELRSRRFSGLEKIIWPSFFLSISPFSNKTSRPKCCRMSLYAGL